MKAKFTIEATLPDDRVKAFEGEANIADGKAVPLCELGIGLLKGLQEKETLHAASRLELTVELLA